MNSELTCLVNKSVLTLVSEIRVKKTPFKSIRLCRASVKERKDEDSKSMYIEPYGPLIVTHYAREKKDHNAKTITRENKLKIRKDFNYKDINNPKIFRDISHEVDKNKYKKLNSQTYWTINNFK